MSTTLTIRNLAEPVKQKLRMRAASHGRSMEAEAREILTQAVDAPPAFASSRSDTSNSVCTSVRGIWKGRMSTDEIMELTRGE